MNLEKTFLRLSIIIIIKKATILEIAPGQKTSCNISNLYVSNY